jgi:small-conductance mechanosensitive channel
MWLVVAVGLTAGWGPELRGQDGVGGALPALDDAGLEGAGEANEAGDLEGTGQAVRVAGDGASDAAIRERLERILSASRRYEGLGVEVREGIVFLSGSAATEGHVEWASNLARRTEDVVAVVNDIEHVPAATESVVRGEARALWEGLVRSLPLVGVGLVLLALAVGLAGLVSRAVGYGVSRLTGSRLLQSVARKLVAVLVVLGGVVLFLRVTGLTGVAVTVVSGTGLLGLIIGFAFRDIAENFLASVLLSVQTPFRLGDVIEVEGYVGVVQRVSARGTVLVDFDGNHIQIANATVYKSTIQNRTANPKMRLHFVVGVGYDTPVAEAQSVTLRPLVEHSAVLDDPEPLVLVEELGASTVNLKVYFWVDVQKHSLIKVRSSVMRRVLAAMSEAGVSMPDDAREVIFPQGVPVVDARGGGAVPPPEGVGFRGEGAGGGGGGRHLPTAEGVGVGGEVVRDEGEVTEAEGDLVSEVGEIQKQAAEARDPEGGPDAVGPGG